jgi:2-polyprenyl-3-methyl-5-hydroxy-6-metoxy-1,4-benzoquinol methylase
LSQLEPLRNSFNDAAHLYDEVRPGYPTHIIDTIITLAELPPNAKFLEIGCGSGQITLPFAARGYSILALELGAALAALATDWRCDEY